MRCVDCGGKDCTEIEIRLKDEGSVRFFSCRRCEAKWWEHQGDQIDLQDVLSLTSQERSR